MTDLIGQRLTAAEAVIERGLATFVEVGAALMSIRDERLYRVEYGTFEDYCQERWGMTRRHANRLVEAAEITLALGPVGPTSERQARELTGLDPDVAAEVMDLAAESGKITAATIRDAREAIQPTKPAEWTCDCGAAFKSPHTHCDTCGDHFPEPVHCPTHTVSVDVSTGEILDGPVESKAPRATARKPLPDQFFDAAYDLSKVTDRIARLADDDRFPQNAEKVAAKHRSDLIRAIDALQGVLNRLPSA